LRRRRPPPDTALSRRLAAPFPIGSRTAFPIRGATQLAGDCVGDPCPGLGAAEDGKEAALHRDINRLAYRRDALGLVGVTAPELQGSEHAVAFDVCATGLL